MSSVTIFTDLGANAQSKEFAINICEELVDPFPPE